MVRPKVRPSEDLMSRLGLNSIAHSVARTDITTGKPYKLRQSYRNQAAVLQIPGVLTSVAHPEGAPGSLTELWHIPPDPWAEMYVRGRDIQDGLPADVLKGMQRTFNMEENPTALSSNDTRWLALEAGGSKGRKRTEEPAPPLRPVLNTSVTESSILSLKLPDPTANRVTDLASPSEGSRPRRSGKKRRYNDDSFEGYGDGFVDDDGASISSLGMDEKRRKRRRVSWRLETTLWTVHRMLTRRIDDRPKTRYAVRRSNDASRSSRRAAGSRALLRASALARAEVTNMV